MVTPDDPETNNNVKNWLNKIDTLSARERSLLDIDETFYVTHYVQLYKIENLGTIFVKWLNIRWPQQNFVFSAGVKNAEGLFTVDFKGNDVLLKFDSVKWGSQNDPTINVNFTCMLKGNDTPAMNLTPNQLLPVSSSRNGTRNCIVS
jgi:hypothetical protein